MPSRERFARSESDLQVSLRDVGLFLSVVLLPLLGLWFEYPIQVPVLDVLVLEKIFFTAGWIVLIGFVYYRTKINRLHARLAA